MTASNGRANGSAIDNPSELAVQTLVPTAMMRSSTGPQFSTDQIKELIAELEVPFDPALIEWRVTNTTKSGKLRGQVIPYADPRAYTDRLNSLFTPAGWTRKYTVHTSANFQRGTDQKTVAGVWRPSQIQDMALLRKLLAHMQGAERGLRRLEAAVGLTGPEALARIFESLKLDSLERVDNIETLKEIVLKLEGVAAEAHR